jgi:hypothetical protein
VAFAVNFWQFGSTALALVAGNRKLAKEREPVSSNAKIL